MTTFTVRVKAVRSEALEIKSFELVPAKSAALQAFAPGSHIDLHLRPGLVRQYSLCNRFEDTGSYVISVKREPQSRGGSQAMHEQVKEGDLLTIGAPRNNFQLHVPAKHHVLMAGGIGITPLLAMARHLLAAHASFELQYFTRSIEHTAFHDLLGSGAFQGNVHFHYALEPEATRAYLRKHLWHRPQGAHLYLCGPRPFMDLVEGTAASTWPPESVHLEYFSADPVSLAGPRGTFKVRLANSGGEYEVPDGKSIVEALAAHGITIETSCQQGVCGTCLTGLRSGEADHRDVFLTDEEKSANDRIMPCVSRAKNDVLVLDL